MPTSCAPSATRKVLLAALFLSGCATAPPPPAEPPPPPPAPAPVAKPVGPPEPTVEEARAWIDRVDARLKKLWEDRERVSWVNQTFITHDTDQLVAQAEAKVAKFTARAIKQATRYSKLKLPPDVARKFHLLVISSTLPAPDNDAERNELTQIGAQLTSMYGKGKYCPARPLKVPGAKAKGDKPKADNCLDLGQLSKILAESRDYETLLEAWKGWRTISPQMKPLYGRLVDLGNKGSREIGFENAGQLWKSRYDMSAAEFEKETDRLWGQVKPLYDQLHCYVRRQLSQKYKGKVAATGPIPAHVLGNMWSQDWSNIYPLVEPYKGQKSIDVTKALERAKYTPLRMVRLGETFFTSLGFPPLPKTFWDRSMFLKPKDRDVVCHASAWDVGMVNDLRIKMCINVNEEDLITIHHELGHNFYYQQYYTRPALFQDGAHDGFHEAIGDALALSVTPGYLKQVGIFKGTPTGDQAVINQQMKDALDKIAFLPFGKLIDQWRWDVFSGKTPMDRYNTAWWELVKKYQGIVPPVARSEADFDPGSKYHVPANVPYTRYFLARILQFQFHRAMCKISGHQGPLHTCSIYGNRAAGEKLKAMLALGASQPWPETLAVLTGQREMDATAILEYFAPLKAWLEKQNQGQTCGW